MTSQVVDNLIQAAAQANPTAPIVEVAEAALETAVNPSVPVIVEDLMLAHSLANDIKAKLAGKHPGVMDIFQWLLNLKG